MQSWRTWVVRLIGGEHALEVRADLEDMYLRERAHGRWAATVMFLKRALVSAWWTRLPAGAPRPPLSGQTWRTAWRGLRAAPSTSLLAAGILGIGIAAATVTFSVVDAVVIRALPFPNADRLMSIGRSQAGSPTLGPQAPQDFLLWQTDVPGFEALGATSQWPLLTLPAEGVAIRLNAQRVTANLFQILDVSPRLGRGFSVEHESAGTDQVVVLSDHLWRQRFAADPNIVGRRVKFGANGTEEREVLGVMPPGFTFPVGPATPVDAWIPAVFRSSERSLATGGRGYSLLVVGRVREGVTVEILQQQVDAATAGAVKAHPSTTFWNTARPVVVSLHDAMIGPPKRWLVLLLVAVALVLVVAYVNVASLLLARATIRRREFAVRATLGASRSALGKTLVLEALLLSVCGAMLGIAAARLGLDVVLAALPPGLARASTIALDQRVLLVAVASAVLTGLACGLIPAWQGSRVDILSVLKQGGAAIGGDRHRVRWQRVLLVSQLAFIVVLLVTTTLVVASFVNVLRVDLGFSRGRLIGFRVSPSLPGGPEDIRSAAALAAVNEIIGAATSVAGVTDVALIDGPLPMFGNTVSYVIDIEGFGKTTGNNMVGYRAITPNYFAVAGINVLRGRTFESVRPGEPEVIINDEAAHRFFGDRDPVGAYLTFRGRRRIVAVVSGVRVLDPEREAGPEMYLPLLEHGEGAGDASLPVTVVARLAHGTDAASTMLQTALVRFTGNRGLPAVRDVDQQFRVTTAERRFNAGLMATFGGVALVLAGVGVYGLLSFLVAQRTRSIGIRMAIGAERRRVLLDVLGETARLVAAGAALGLAGGVVAARALRSIVFGLTGTEWWVFGMVVAMAAGISLVGALVPALRAARVDPMIALRQE